MTNREPCTKPLNLRNADKFRQTKADTKITIVVKNVVKTGSIAVVGLMSLTFESGLTAACTL